MDGKVIIGTSLDTKGIDTGLANLERSLGSKMSKLENSVSRIGKTIKNVVIGIGIGYLFKQLTSNIGGAISRLDTLSNYTKVMSNLGISAQDAEKSISYLSDKLIGLPTTLDSAVRAVQRFTSANGNIQASTQMFLGLNNAILAGGANMQIQTSALEQLSQAYTRGKPDMMEWRTAMTAMPAQLKQVAIAMGYVDADALGSALRSGKVSMNEFMVTVNRLNKQGVAGFKSFEEQARNATGGVATSITNVKTAFTRGLAQIMTAIGQSNIAGFFNGIASAINRVVPYIQAFVKIVVRAVSAISALFGKKTSTVVNDVSASAAKATTSMGDLSGSLEETNEGLDGATGSAKKLAKELKNLQGFDELNVLQEPSSSAGSGGGAGGGGAIAPIDLSEFTLDAEQQVDDLIGNIEKRLLELFKPLQNSWEKYGKKVVKSMEHSFSGMSDLFGSIGRSYEEVWLNGTGERTTDLIMRNLIAIFDTIGNIGGAFANAWNKDNKGTKTIQNLWDGFNNIYEIIVEVQEVFAEWTGSESYQIFANSIVSIGETISEIFSMITEKIKEVWENGGKETFTKLLEAFSKITELLSVVFNVLKPIINTVLKIAVPIIQQIVKTIGTLLDALKGLLDFLIGVFTGDWERAWNGILQFFWNIFKAIGNILGSFVKGIYENVVKPVIEHFANLWNKIIESAQGAFNNITGIFGRIGEWFGGVINGIIDRFRNFGYKAGEVVSGAFRAVVNGVLGAIERILNSPIRAINNLIGVINKVPGINLGRLNTFNLPRLKVGGIVNMPNKGTLVGSAYAGEAGREGVIPLTDQQAMSELGREIGRNVLVNLTNITEINGRVISRELKNIQSEQNFAYNI